MNEFKVEGGELLRHEPTQNVRVTRLEFEADRARWLLRQYTADEVAEIMDLEFERLERRLTVRESQEVRYRREGAFDWADKSRENTRLLREGRRIERRRGGPRDDE